MRRAEAYGGGAYHTWRVRGWRRGCAVGRQSVAYTARGLSPLTIKETCGTSRRGRSGMREPPPVTVRLRRPPFSLPSWIRPRTSASACGLYHSAKRVMRHLAASPTLLPSLPRADRLYFTGGVTGRGRLRAVRAARCFHPRTASPSRESQVEQLRGESGVRGGEQLGGAHPPFRRVVQPTDAAGEPEKRSRRKGGI